jgi:ABC-type uncharacterized transport system involved in gliding motility auxiliary subunit
MNRTTKKTYSGIAGALLLLGVLVAANALLAGARVRKDVTEERLYTLSDGTVGMLGQLERPVSLKLYFSRSNPNVPVPLKNYVQRTTDFLREVESRSGGKVSVEVLDPRPDTETEEWAQRYGLAPQSVGGIGSLPEVYLGLVAASGVNEASIPVLAPTLEPQMEYLVARLIQEVTRTTRSRIGLVTGLPVLGTPGFGGMRSRSDWLFVEEMKAQYEVVPVAMDAKELPDDLDALMLVHPKRLGEELLFAIDQYLLGGGRILAFVDPMCISDDDPASAMGPSGLSSDLNRFAEAWGVRMEAGQVAADLAAATPVNLGDGRAETLPAWLTLRGATSLDREEVATGSLDLLMLPFAGIFAGEPAEGIEMTKLAWASPDAVALGSHMAQSPLDQRTRDGTPSPGAALAVRLSGRFATAFPDGRPKAGDEDGTEAGVGGDADEESDGHLKVGERDGVVVMVADADMLANPFAAQSMNFFGRVFHQPINDNLNFALNFVEQLSGNPALIGLRSRGQTHRPFERVLQMEQAAQERWQEEEEKLQAKLEAAQERLNQLQEAQGDDSQLVLGAAQRAEIEKFRLERFETQRELTQVRRNLRQSIERLGLGLKIANMAAVPFLVALFGAWHGWSRRRRAAARS